MKLALYLIFSVPIVATLVLVISQFKELVVYKKGIYPDGLNLIYRPWGLKIKELKWVQENVGDDVFKSKVSRVIYLRILGLRLLVSFPLLCLIWTMIAAFNK